MNYQHDPNDYQAMLDMGIERGRINSFEVLPVDEYCMREYFSIRLENGYDVPEERQPRVMSRFEREHRYHEMLEVRHDEIRNRIPEMFADPYEYCDFDELTVCEWEHDYVPEHIYNSRREKERRENREVLFSAQAGRRARNAEISKKLLASLARTGKL